MAIIGSIIPGFGGGTPDSTTDERIPYKIAGTFQNSPLYFDVSENKIVSDVSIEVPEGSIELGEVVTLSEGANSLILSDGVKSENYHVIKSKFDATGSDTPTYPNLGAQSTLDIQIDDGTTITDNPLTYSLVGTVVAPDVRQVNAITYRTGAIMTNVRGKVTDNVSGVVVRYIPSKAIYDAGVGGLTFVSGDNKLDFISTDTDTPGVFNLGVSPFIIEEGQQLDFEIVADVVNILGNVSNVPYQTAFIQDGPFEPLATAGSSSPGGLDRSVQYNDSSTFGGTSKFKYTDSDNFATITLESLTATGGGGLIVNNSSAFQRLNIIYSEVLGKTIIESIQNDIDITTNSALTINYSGSSAVFDDTTGDNSFTLNSSASDKDVGFYLNDSSGNAAFSVVHNDVSGQTSLQIKSDAGNTKFATTFNQTLDDIFITSGSGASLYFISDDTMTLESNDTMLIETLGDYSISMKNDNAIFNINSSSADYSFGFSNQEPSTDPLFIWAKDDVSGGVCRVYLRNATPEGAITAAGGSLCIRSSGTSSNIYLKLSDATNTDWQSLLGDVIGPATSTDNAIATWNGTDGLNLNDSYGFLSSDANNTRLSIDNVSISGQSGIQIRNHLSETRYSVIYNQTLGDIFVTTALGINYDLTSNGRINMSSLSSATFGSSADETVTISNDNATLLINDSAQNYRFDISNNQPNTNPLIRFIQSGTNGGQSRFFFSALAPEGVITGNGGDICIRDAGASSDIYLKRSDGTNTGWVDLLHASSGVQGPLTSTDNALAVWDGTDGLTLQDSFTSLVSSASSTVLSVKNVSATGQSGFAIQNSFGFDRYSLTYNQSTNAVFMTTNSGTSYSNVVDGSLEHLSNSNVAIGSFGNQTVELYNTNATLRLDTSANGGRLFFSNIAADTAEMIRLFKAGTNGGATEIYLTSRTPTGNITGNGGDICIRDAGTSSNVYIKRVDGGTTGWNVALTSPVETSTLYAIPSFDVTTGNSLSPVNTATVSANTSTTTLQLRPVTSAGNAEIDFRTSSGSIRTQFYYDEDVNTTNLEANTAKLNIGNFGGPISFSSTSGDSDLYIRTSSPTGSLIGNYGDLAIDISSNPSMYMNTGTEEIWSRFTLDSDFDAYGGFGRLQNMLMWSEDLSNPVWTKAGSVAPTITPNYATAPNGETTANRVQFTGGTGVAGLIRQALTFTASQNYTFSIWIKHVSGGNSFQVDFGDGASYTITASTEWQRYIINGVAGNANWFDIQDFGAAEYLFWGLQINDGTEAYPYLKTEDLAKLEVDEYGLSVDGKIVFDKADTDNLVTNLGTGVCCGGDLSVNGGDNTLLDVTGGSALIADYSSSDEPFIREITWSTQTIDPDLTTAWNKWVGVQESSTPGIGEFVFDTEFTQLEKRTVAIVGRCWTSNTGTGVITGVGQYTTPAFGQAYTANDLSFIFSSINKYGNTYSANGANLLLDKSIGLSYRFGAGWATTPESPNVHVDDAQTGITAYYYILSGSTSATVETAIDPDNYDNAGTKTAVPAGKFTLQRLYYFPVSQVCMVTYGQTVYSSMAEAIGSAGQDVVDVEEALIDGSILRGWLAVEQGTTALNNNSNALFKEARSVSEPAAKGTTGTSYSLKSYSLADVGSEDTSYAGGFYDYSTTSATLTIGGTVTQTFGSTDRMSSAHAFVVASGAGGTDLVLTVSGTSFSDDGILTTSDSEIIVPDTDQATTDQYFESSKKWIGQVTYTLTGTAGSFTFNYGFAKYEDFANRDFTVQDFEFVGKAAANSANNLIVLLHHSPNGWTYAATGFKPFPTAIASNATDLSTYRNFTLNTYFAYKRAGLSYFVEGSGSEGIIIEYTQSTNNPIYYANTHVGVLI